MDQDHLAALLNAQPPQLLPVAVLRHLIKYLEDAALAYRAELEIRWMQRAVDGALMDSLPEEINQDIFMLLCNTLEPRIAVNFSSACKMLWKLMQRPGAGASPSLLQKLKDENKAAAALCLKMGKRSCKELREAKSVDLRDLDTADLLDRPLASAISEVFGRSVTVSAWPTWRRWARWARS